MENWVVSTLAAAITTLSLNFSFQRPSTVRNAEAIIFAAGWTAGKPAL